jgi:hypothetical protein
VSVTAAGQPGCPRGKRSSSDFFGDAKCKNGWAG